MPVGEDSIVVTFWLPNTPDVQGEIVAAFGRVGDETFELDGLQPEYPDGFAGPAVRIEATFRRVDFASILVSFDQFFRNAFSPWPGRQSVTPSAGRA